MPRDVVTQSKFKENSKPKPDGYNRIEPETLGDGRRRNPGAPPLLNDIQQAQLWLLLSGKAPDGGLWNGRKGACSLSELTRQPISRQQGGEYLKQMCFRCPRRVVMSLPR